jgi:segregation and condensation protein A
VSQDFTLRLDNFEGPFDLLLSLISARKLDITEVALSEVTDEFIAYVRDLPAFDLSIASEFVVVAATLLDLKSARLLPGFDEEDSEDLELLEARDLLFARLLQYRAYKDISAVFADRMVSAGRRRPRVGMLEPHFASLLPDLVWTTTAQELADMAAAALQPKAAPTVSLTHLHAPAASVREQAAIVAGQLSREGVATFRALTSGAEQVIVVARFLALLELFRQGHVSFEQAAPLGELTVRWTGGEASEVSSAVEEFAG